MDRPRGDAAGQAELTDQAAALAVHEAGHAVAHLALADAARARGQDPETQLQRLDLYGDDKGRVKFAIRPAHDVRDQAVRCLAGYAAECRHRFGPDWQPSDAAMACDDADLVMARAELAVLSDPAAELCRAWEAAWALVTTHWPALLTAAGRLHAVRSMSGAEFAAAWHDARQRSETAWHAARKRKAVTAP